VRLIFHRVQYVHVLNYTYIFSTSKEAVICKEIFSRMLSRRWPETILLLGLTALLDRRIV